jgi:hemoglobin
VALVPLALGALLLLLIWIRVKSCMYRLTTQRLFVRRGWLAKHVNELELYRVKDVVVDQGALQRLLGYGTVTVLAADDTTPAVDLVRISRPTTVKEMIRTQYRAARQREGCIPQSSCNHPEQNATTRRHGRFMAATTRGVSVRISVGETSQAGVRHGDGPEPKNNKQKEQTKKHEITNRRYCLITAALALPLQAAQTTEKSLYERLGGVFAIAAVVDHFSDAVVQNPIVGKTSQNPALREWHTKNLDRLPGLKFMRTLWVCEVTGGPFKFSPTKPGKTHLGLEEAHRDLKISPEEFDEVAAELGAALTSPKDALRASKGGSPSRPFAAH